MKLETNELLTNARAIEHSEQIETESTRTVNRLFKLIQTVIFVTKITRSMDMREIDKVQVQSSRSNNKNDWVRGRIELSHLYISDREAEQVT